MTKRIVELADRAYETATAPMRPLNNDDAIEYLEELVSRLESFLDAMKEERDTKD